MNIGGIGSGSEVKTGTGLNIIYSHISGHLHPASPNVWPDVTNVKEYAT